MTQPNDGLPREAADRFTLPLSRFLRIEAAAGVLLLLAATAALLLANSPWAGTFLRFWKTPVGLEFGPHDFSRSLSSWINDGLMTLFFFVVALELKRELVLGELRDLRLAALPLAGALGGMLVPISVYLIIMAGKLELHGWGTVMATDTAFVIGCVALFGRRVPASLRLFLLSLAIFDDVGAIVVVAIGYSENLNAFALALAALVLAVVAGLARLGIRDLRIYFLLGGLLWICLDVSGIHATAAGVVLGFITPTAVWVSDTRLRGILGGLLAHPTGEHWSGDTENRRDLLRAGIAVTESLSPVERLEMLLHPWTGFMIMPLFALANAGVVISPANLQQAVSVAIFAGLALGKPLGVLSFSWLAVRLGLAVRVPGLTWPFLAAGAFLTGIGFTMSLFIAGVAFSPAVLGAAKIGILSASIVSAAVGIVWLTWLTRRNASNY
ncbi:Na+/H+ antiporter NhaA [Acuticoccus sp. M5D2P5]|uniref:Na+/H+ antiporter NhaA n=1 Tax=Acuticoccus kalidii TaxID=2910977 RepID=UPI001F1E5FE3|nr:Na+/H+ antiporter NhaA [Acuticoccus kalidii]MCF3934139.1 Na+/H+ antiporter NhaA [Acuticoccus kalidii]